MNYLEWNNAIGSFYFNLNKAEKEINLFISKSDIIQIGRNSGFQGKDKEIFNDYINAVKNGPPGSSLYFNILEAALYSYKIWKKNPIKIDNIIIEYPLYIGYLALFILPVTDNLESHRRADSYYPKIDKFLKKYDLPKMPRQNYYINWNGLWEDLQFWSQTTKNTELGNFQLHPFSNQSWVYVGKPLSQCIFPPKSIKYLPKFFELCGLVPNEEVQLKYIRQILIVNGRRLLDLPRNVINIIKNEENEIGHSIVNLVYRNFRDWKGNTDYYVEGNQDLNKGITISQLRLCVEGNKLKGYTFYYRLYTELDFPEDLKFIYNEREIECMQFGRGWSKNLNLEFVENLTIKDEHNKWVAKFPEKPVRILIEGRNFHMSGWVEVPTLGISTMLVLSKAEYDFSIEKWGESFSHGNFIKIKSSGIPNNYSLYQIKNPPCGHPTIHALQFKTDKKIKIIGGLKIETRTWLIDLLPEVEIENGDGSEKIYLIYENNQHDKIYLKRKNSDQPIWQIPNNVNLNDPFYIRADNQDLNADNLKNLIIDSYGKTYLIKESYLPARDKFGQIICKEKSNSYILGSRLSTNIERPYYLKQAQYDQFFKPASNNSISIEKGNNTIINNKLLNYLSVKIECGAPDYYEAFESIYQESFEAEEIENQELSLALLKRWSINYLDYMGILDYEYSNKKIIVNPPQFLLIPVLSGRKVLLIGGRTSEFLSNLKIAAEKEDLNFDCEPQDKSLKPFLLPPTITISGFNQSDNNVIERKIKKVSEICGITFNNNKITQFRLAAFSGDIGQYKDQLVPDDNFIDLGWSAREFDPNELKFIPKKIEDIDKSWALVEYRLTEYNFKHRLWINGVSFNVNKNWGRFIYLNSLKKNVFFNDRELNMVAIPSSLPLPRLLSEALLLYSGKAPKRKLMNFDGQVRWYNIYSNIPHPAAYNTCLKVGQKLQEKTFAI
ncbi:hypothetical protein [Aegicerativicinus sediminis]|uniref:hypothetical protein n=1 Tax=Aegicerativicinus sediminis TaxID=2893202 RepID=UPI001E34E441|nr:hypothetical protein [Aegicerativicinus sediminis]